MSSQIVVIMAVFKTILFFEIKRFLGKKSTIIILSLGLLFSMTMIQLGINEYKAIAQNKTKFKEFESLKISQYVNYTQYGSYGIQVLFVPSPLSLFFTNSVVASDLNAFVDSGERLKIYHPLKGKHAFGARTYGFADFSGILLFFATLLTLFYGYDTFKNREFSRLLSALCTPNRLFRALVLARVLILTLMLFILIASTFALVRLNGIPLEIDQQFLAFFCLILLVAIFFFSIGTFLGACASKVTAIILMLSCWFFFLFLIPFAINSFITWEADKITPANRLEMEKLKILMDFEKRAIEKAGTFDYGKEVTDARRDLISSYWDKEFKKIQALEQSMILEMNHNVSLFQDLSLISPTTFYFSVTQEISSRGYMNLVDFYDYVLQLKQKFFKFYMEKVYFSNFSRVVPFITGDENIFYAKSRLPGNFGIGILITILYIVLFLGFSFYHFLQTLFKLEVGQEVAMHKPVLQLKHGQFRVLVIEGERFKNLLFSLFSGKIREICKKGLIQRVLVDGRDIAVHSLNENFVYLCHPEHIPGDIRGDHFLFLLAGVQKVPLKVAREIMENPYLQEIGRKRFSQMKNLEKFELLLTLAAIKKSPVYLIHDVTRGMPLEASIHLKGVMENLKDSNSLVLFLTSGPLVANEKWDRGYDFWETPSWATMVDRYQEINEIEMKA